MAQPGVNSTDDLAEVQPDDFEQSPAADGSDNPDQLEQSPRQSDEGVNAADESGDNDVPQTETGDDV